MGAVNDVRQAKGGMKPERARLIKGIIQIADPKIWIASTVPMAVGGAIAWCFGQNVKPLSPLWFVIAVIAVYLVETAKNALNEVVDYQSGVDPDVDEEHRTPFSGGKKTIVDGVLTLTQCFYVAIICFLIAGVMGVALAVFVEPAVFLIGLAGFALSVLYSLPPFKLCYRGLGELAVGITFGPIITLGMHALITGGFSTLALLASLPIGFCIINVLWINQFPDYEVDKAGGKRNWVVRLGKEKSVYVYAMWYALMYAGVVAVAIYAGNIIWLLPLLTLPIAVKSVINCYRNHGDIKKLMASNAATVQIYQLLGLSFVLSAVLDSIVF